MFKGKQDREEPKDRERERQQEIKKEGIHWNVSSNAPVSVNERALRGKTL